MLAGTAAYAPTVLVAAHRPQVMQGADPRRSPDGSYPAYRLLSLDAGWASLRLGGKEKVVRAPACVLLLPGVAYGPFAFGRGATGVTCSFLVRAGSHGPRSWTQAVRAVHPTEPLPMETWGAALPEVLAPDQAAVMHLALERIASLWWRGPAGAYEASLLLAQALARLALPVMGEGPTAPKESSADPLAARAVAMVRDALPARLGLPQVARACGLSRSSFIRRFTAATGMAPGEAFDRARLAEARSLLLRDRTAPMAAIARACGWRDASAFGRAFRRAHGRSPHAWRCEGAVSGRG